MTKRKQPKAKDSDDEGSDSDVSLINVDFDFFDPNPKVDYHALKRLLAQLFQSDADLFHLGELTDLILKQPLVGTTVKTDGIEGDPLAVLTVLNLFVHQNHPSISALLTYILQKSSSSSSFHSSLQSLIGPGTLKSPNAKHIGFVFSERLVNMPVQVVPPMYRMLMDEIKWAVDDNEPYTFSHYIFLTRTYRLSPSQAAELEKNRQEGSQSRPSKKRKAKTPTQLPTSVPSNSGDDGSSSVLTYSFHPEDEYIQKYATHTLDYPLTHPPSPSPSSEDRSEGFGLDVAGRMMLVPSQNFAPMVQEMGEAYAANSVLPGAGSGSQY